MDIAGIRHSFVRYYEGMGYQLLPSAPMIDPSIPMSFVMSAGLVQVENSISKLAHRQGNQFVLVQDCFRHFDLDKVGTDDIHLSLFEMPGAFVFGPDGKNGTVQRMWTLATQILGIEKDRIWVSYFKGGEVMGESLAEDKITRQAWVDAGVPEHHIVGLGPDNNYWIQGRGIEDTSIVRKCGPNTELFFDRGGEKACGPECNPGCRCGRFVEFSNSLFICSEIANGSEQIRPLANPFTETVIGAERVSMLLQGCAAVFEINEFQPIINSIRRLHASNLPVPLTQTCERVIADHLRGLYYLVDGGAPPPGKNGRERIIKTLIRRVITRLMVLDISPEESIPHLIDVVAKSVPDPETHAQTKMILLGYFQSQIHRFTETIARGQRELAQLLTENNGSTLTGQQIYYLEKKCGYPSLLTNLSLRKQGLVFEESEYQNCLRAN
jgi:alanyl-tRNA synthetase